jgi:WhiB family transcriptional regulator, redox-sensing transcriptional regulator
MPDSSVAVLARQARAVDGLLPCQRENPQLWFSELPADLELAKAYCGPCPLRGPCLAGAVARGEPHGVWGGQIFAQGAIVAQKRPRGRPPARSASACRRTGRDRSTAVGPGHGNYPNGPWCAH